MSRTYERQVQEQINQYRDVEDMQGLPKAYNLWSGAFAGPPMQSVFGIADITTFYVQAFLSAGAHAGPVPCFLSLGCGDGSVEIEIAQSIVERGVRHFRFVCIDLSDVLLDRFRKAIPAELVDNFDLVQGDLNAITFEAQFDAVMANHSLHHMVDLEGIFAFVHAKLTDSGVFVTNDMIGRNGHMRWPEARILVDFFWPFLSQKQRSNVLLQRAEPRFLDFDCSCVGFEGVRAQDILPLILKQGFHPWKFLGFGGGVDVFVDRCFGGNFDPADPNDVFLLNRIGFLNELMLDSGLIKPTMMLAYFTKSTDRTPVFYRGRTALSAARDTAETPSWVAAAQADLATAECPEEFVFRLPNAPAPLGQHSSLPSTESPPEATTVLAALRDAQAQAAEAHLALERERLRTLALEQSSSWRLTAPLRFATQLARQAWKQKPLRP